MERLLTVKQTAEYLQVNEQYVRDVIASGQLEAAKLGKAWRIKESDIMQFLDSMKPVKQLAGKSGEEVAEELKRHIADTE